MVDQTEILPAGNLRHDREFALFDADGRYVNAKRTAEIHRIRAQWDLAAWSVSLSTPDISAPVNFQLDQDREQLAHWLSQFFRMPVRIEQRKHGGFPDDEAAAGPTIVTTATLQAVAEWFPGLEVDEVRRRFRANLELAGSESFSEDRLFASQGKVVDIEIGTAMLVGTNPCQRCVVPTRSSQTGEPWPAFQKIFAEKRKASLPVWTDCTSFNHFYRLAVNTRSQTGNPQSIQIGDRVRLLGSRDL